MKEHILEIKNISRTFKSGTHDLTVVKDMSFAIETGASCAIVGPSGSGKTTLLGIAAGLDKPTKGSVVLNGITLENQNEDGLAGIRNKYVGFIFQAFQLVPTLTALENVMVPLELRGESSAKVRQRAKELLHEVGLEDRGHHYPTQLSGGEQQRVAIARAFINNPKILFADEPTGNLDAETSATIEQLLFDLNKKENTTLVVVTHDPDLAKKCERIILLKNGAIASDSKAATAHQPADSMLQ